MPMQSGVPLLRMAAARRVPKDAPAMRVTGSDQPDRGAVGFEKLVLLLK